MDAIICVTVVLPLLPVTAISGRWQRCRHAAASSPRRRPRVGHLQPGQPRLGEPAFGQCRDAPAALACAQEVVRVEPLALQRDEKVAGLQRARVAVHAADDHVAVADERGRWQQGMRLGQRHHGRSLRTPVLAASIACASATSEKGCFTPATS
jgi:hypothetical protein